MPGSTSFIERLALSPRVSTALARRREKRAQWIMSFISPVSKIIDIGCGIDGRSLEDYLPDHCSVVGVDLHPPDKVSFPSSLDFTYFQQDARDLSRWADDEFDAAISIGMMEHICDREALEEMSREIRRVARQWVIIVPWRYGWLEPHFKFPFFGILPAPLQRFLTRTLNLHDIGAIVTRDPDYLARHYQWLTNDEWKVVYPNSEVFLSATKETIAIVGKRADETKAAA